MSSEKLNFVTVTFKEELPLLELQASSFARFIDPASCGSIALVINEEDESFEAFVRGEIARRYGPLRAKLEIIPIRELVQYPMRSYLRQQVAKIMIAARQNERHYICLDTKNFFVRSPDEETFFREGRPVGCFQPLRGVIQVKSSHVYSDFFGVPRLAEGDPVMAIMTPFVIETESALALVSEVDRRTGQPFDAAFATQPAQSEFMLYFMFLKYFRPAVLAEYEPSPYLSRTFWAHSANGPGELADALEKSKTDQVLTIGLHRNRLAAFTDEEWWAMGEFLGSIGLPRIGNPAANDDSGLRSWLNADPP